ncbi:hypothetical protein Ae201684P_013579 [Aphanomyces euteiches]|nr:hypothetical protein Ae201684P_013579 [Aphanomyces euteiches]
MGNRLSFLRRKRLKAAPPVVAVAEVPLVAPTPPPEKFDDSSFWVGLKAALKFKKGAAPTLEPLDRSLFHPCGQTQRDLAERSCHVAFHLCPVTSCPRRHPWRLAFKCTIQHDPTLGRAYTHLAHTLLLETQTDSTLEQIVGCLENALKYDDMEVRENTILMAEVYSMLGRHDMALQVYRKRRRRMGKRIPHGTLSLGSGGLNAPPTPNQTLILADVNALIHPPMVATSCC